MDLPPSIQTGWRRFVLTLGHLFIDSLGVGVDDRQQPMRIELVLISV